MGARIPVTFQRVAAAFDQGARVRLCESSGSEHSAAAESFGDLSDLVNSFIERGNYGGDSREDAHEEIERDSLEIDEELEGGYWSDSETKDTLRGLLDKSNGGDHVKQNILAEVEHACQVIGDRSDREFKRKLMTHLRHKRFDAGLCKSKWAKSSRFPAGDYEFVDVNVNGTRYIVEPFFTGEFEIARPTSRYTSLLNVLPQIFIGEVEELKKIVRIMCTAIKKSMKEVDMPIPPWRRNGYMLAKWFGSYKRTTSAVPTKAFEFDEGFDVKRSSFGFEAMPTKSYYCRDDFATKTGLRIGNLTAAFQAKGIGMEL
ncbi:hypothetical protein M0R45_012793 [Rubus argutus]|uniref:DUF506 family protein n=1 Tax=Rubus argutus TaxID=59490 RepID=A0AAW1XHQ1_RUBAR